jgi:hypothetical protein
MTFDEMIPDPTMTVLTHARASPSRRRRVGGRIEEGRPDHRFIGEFTRIIIQPGRSIDPILRQNVLITRHL